MESGRASVVFNIGSEGQSGHVNGLAYLSVRLRLVHLLQQCGVSVVCMSYL
jgi:hypothetical protein